MPAIRRNRSWINDWKYPDYEKASLKFVSLSSGKIHTLRFLIGPSSVDISLSNDYTRSKTIGGWVIKSNGPSPGALSLSGFLIDAEGDQEALQFIKSYKNIMTNSMNDLYEYSSEYTQYVETEGLRFKGVVTALSMNKSQNSAFTAGLNISFTFTELAVTGSSSFSSAVARNSISAGTGSPSNSPANLSSGLVTKYIKDDRVFYDAPEFELGGITQITYGEYLSRFLSGLRGNTDESGENEVIPVIGSTVGGAKKMPGTSRAIPLSSEARTVVSYTVMGEARGESYEGQLAVAQVIFDRCWMSNTGSNGKVLVQANDPISICKARNQFDGSSYNGPISPSVASAVKAIFEDGQRITPYIVLSFYSPTVLKKASQWHEAQRFIMEIGTHRFFQPKY